MDEKNLIRLFTDLTGESERTAQSVIMYLDILTDHDAGPIEEALEQPPNRVTPLPGPPSASEQSSI